MSNFSNIMGGSEFANADPMGISGGVAADEAMDKILGKTKKTRSVDLFGKNKLPGLDAKNLKSMKMPSLLNNKKLPVMKMPSSLKTQKFTNMKMPSGLDSRIFKNKMVKLESKMKTNLHPENVGFKRLKQQKGLSLWGDKDGDKLANILDCNPLDRTKQGGAHKVLSFLGRGKTMDEPPLPPIPQLQSYKDKYGELEVYGRKKEPLYAPISTYKDVPLKGTESGDVEYIYGGASTNINVEVPSKLQKIKDVISKKPKDITSKDVQGAKYALTLNINKDKPSFDPYDEELQKEFALLDEEDEPSKFRKGLSNVWHATGAPQKLQKLKEEKEWMEGIRKEARQDALKEGTKIRAKEIYESEVRRTLGIKDTRTQDVESQKTSVGRRFVREVDAGVSTGVQPFVQNVRPSIGSMMGLRAGTGPGFAMMAGYRADSPFAVKVAGMIGDEKMLERAQKFQEQAQQYQRQQQQQQQQVTSVQQSTYSRPEQQRASTEQLEGVWSPYSKRKVGYTRGPYRKHR